MSDPICPFGGNCPHVACIKHELEIAEEETKNDMRDIYKSLRDMSKTLYVIAGILMLHLGITVI